MMYTPFDKLLKVLHIHGKGNTFMERTIHLLKGQHTQTKDNTFVEDFQSVEKTIQPLN